jgi:hypothetical protein
MTDLLADWRSGVPLSSALDAFTKVRRPRSEPASSTPLGGWQRLAESDPEHRDQWLEAGASLGKLHSEMSRSAEFSSRQRQQFFAKIQSGELVGLGWSATATADDPPQKVPIHLFEDRFIKWGKSEIHSEHFHFRQVRILQAPASPDPNRLDRETARNPDADLTAKPGPKPADEILLSIYDELLSAGVIPEKHTRKQAWRAVHKRALANHKDRFPGERGLSYPSFARHLERLRSQK